MTGPYYLGSYGKQPAIVDSEGIPVPRAVAVLLLRALTETHWDMTDGQIQIVRIDKENARRGRR